MGFIGNLGRSFLDFQGRLNVNVKSRKFRVCLVAPVSGLKKGFLFALVYSKQNFKHKLLHEIRIIETNPVI